LLVLAIVIAGLAVIVVPDDFPNQPIGIPSSKGTPQLQTSYVAAFFLAPDGSLWTWGESASFVTAPTSVPQQVARGTQWKRMAHRFTLAAAIQADGSLWTWSYVDPAKSSNSVAAARAPTRLGWDSDWADMAAGASHALALKKDGTLWAWGQNDRGQVGDGRREDRKDPVRISDARNWKTIAASHFNGYALDGNGTIWRWGMAIPSDNKTNDMLRPQPIEEGTNWMAMSAGDYHLAAIKADGTLWILGHNARVAAPDFGARDTTNFVQVGSDTNWVAIHSGANSFLAGKRDGSWWGCGENTKGELGLRSSSSDVQRPTVLPLRFEPWALDAGGRRTLVLLGDGTLWQWGEPFKTDAGFGAKVKKRINKITRAIGVGSFFRTSPTRRAEPVKIWEIDP
jgi:alpha-tubulin suppressor-like RCC1 family protein